MTVFAASFSSVTMTNAAIDIIEIIAHATTRVRILEVELGQSSEFADAAAEALDISFHRGFTTPAAGGTAITAANGLQPLNAYERAAVSTVTQNNTTLATTAGLLVFASGWNIQMPFVWRPQEDHQQFPHRRQILLKPSQSMVVRLSAAADPIEMSGTIVFEEIGKSPQS